MAKIVEKRRVHCGKRHVGAFVIKVMMAASLLNVGF